MHPDAMDWNRRRFDLSWLRTSVGILLEKAAVAAVAIE